jgi:isochorismate hydrolase
MVEFSATANECALLIHDIGEGLRTPGKRLYDPTGASVIAAIARLADFCRSKKMPFSTPSSATTARRPES